MRRPRFTALGVKAALFYGFLVLAFYAAPYANLFFMLLVFLSVTGAWAFVATSRNLRGLLGAEWIAGPSPAGSPLSGRIRLRGTPLSPALRLDFRLPDGTALRIPCAWDSTQTLSVQVPPLPRGVYAFSSARLTSSWPLGVFRSGVEVEGGPLVVYPTPADLVEWRGRAGGRGDDAQGRGATEENQPSSLREFRPGDELRRVHWKATARRGSPVVKEYESHDAVGKELVLDGDLPPPEFERALSLVTALALEIKSNKGSLLLHGPGRSEQFGEKGSSWDDLFRWLAELQPTPPELRARTAGPGVQRVGSEWVR